MAMKAETWYPDTSTTADAAFVSSAAWFWGCFGGSLAEKQEINRKQLSLNVQLGLFPDICSPSASKEVPVPLDGRVCSSTTKVQERGTQAWHSEPQPGFSPLVSGQASVEALNFTMGELCVSASRAPCAQVRRSLGCLCVRWGL